MKKIALLLALLVFASVFAGCNNNADPSTTAPITGGSGDTTSTTGSTPTGTGRDEVVVHVEAPWNTLDPHDTGAYVDMYLINQMYEQLVFVEDDGTVTPSLAEKWTVSEDGKTYTFTLRQDVKFHNGENMKASDVAFSFNRAKGMAQMYDYTVMIDSAEATGDYEVVIKLRSAFAPFLSYVAKIAILNEKFLGENSDISRTSCGTGPYVMKDVNMNTEAHFEAFADYYKGEAAIKKIHFRIIIDTTSAIMAFKSGELDFVYPNATTYLELSGGSDFNTAGVATLHTAAICMNNEVAPFDQVEVRQALNYATDRASMILVAFEGLAEPARLLAAEASFGVDYANAKEYPYDLDKAKELFAKHGITDLGTMYTISGGYHEKIAQVLQSSLSQIGVKVEIMPMESSTLIEMMTKGEYTFGNMGLGYSNDFAYNSRYYTSGAIGSGNFDRYSNPRVDELFSLAEAETDTAKRLEYYGEAVKLITEDAPDIPVFHKQLLFAWSKDINAVPHVDSGKPYFVYEWSWN